MVHNILHKIKGSDITPTETCLQNVILKTAGNDNRAFYDSLVFADVKVP